MHKECLKENKKCQQYKEPENKQNSEKGGLYID